MSLERKMGRKKPRNDKAAHMMVAGVAQGIAGCAYEELARNNDFYAIYPDQTAFIRDYWKQFVSLARSQLTDMLTMDSVSVHEKDAIAEALMLDGALNPPLAHADAEAQRLTINPTTH